MDRNLYANTQSGGAIWHEPIYSCAWGSTSHLGKAVIQDAPGNNYPDIWGSPFTGGCPFVLCDGSVRMIPYGFDLTQALNSNSGLPSNLP